MIESPPWNNHHINFGCRCIHQRTPPPQAKEHREEAENFTKPEVSRTSSPPRSNLLDEWWPVQRFFRSQFTLIRLAQTTGAPIYCKKSRKLFTASTVDKRAALVFKTEAKCRQRPSESTTASSCSSTGFYGYHRAFQTARRVEPLRRQDLLRQ